MNQPYATFTLASALHEMFGVQLYKNNAHTLLSRILNLDWLQHARSVRGVYEYVITNINYKYKCDFTYQYPLYYNPICYKSWSFFDL